MISVVALGVVIAALAGKRNAFARRDATS
jgi:hypothetical protein